jgi:DNA-binding IclR family transcriptional regulator
MPNTGLVSNIQVGSRVPAHLTTPGRMLIAHLSPEALRERLGDDPLPTVTGQSPATHARLAEILGADLERGCAWSFSAFEPGIDACAAPVMDATGDVIAAISVAGPQQRFEADGTLRERVEKEVKAAAKDLSALLGYRAGKR